jgi:ribonucleoside-diphosphate reductase alpha chain
MSKETLKAELEDLKKRNEAPEWMNWMSYAMLVEDYLLGQTPRQRYRTMARAAAQYLPDNYIPDYMGTAEDIDPMYDRKVWEEKFFQLFWKGYLAPSTPVMGNLGTNRGLAVSCSASYVGDTMWDISYTGYEMEMLSKSGFGTAAFLDIRGGYEPIKTGGYTNPTSDWIYKYWDSQNKVSQAGLRRGSTALYLDFWQKDLLEVLPMMEKLEKLHLGVICDDSVKAALERGDEEAMKRYLTILTWRARKGKPYIIFIDNARRQDPPFYKERGLSTKQSNLCTEIFQHTDSDHTLSCVLSSMNGYLFDEFEKTEAVFEATVFLDCVNEDLIQRGSKLVGLERVVASAKKSRALGLGLLGFHSYLQSKSIAMDSFEARMANAKIFKHLHDESLRASAFMAAWLGEPEWLKGTGLRNSHLTAMAPNTSSAFMAGAKSQGIEPLPANIYQQKLAKVGSVERINPELLKILRERGFDNEDIMESISNNKGSVQHLDSSILSDHEKNVFKTAYEINQKLLIDLAEHRQQWIDQGQSLNLFFDANEDEAWIHEVHKHAFQQTRLKSLYYVRTQSGISADKDDTCKACEG